jgi:hypothetical protein
MSDKCAALQTIIGKLAKLIPLLASDKPGEVLNAVQAIRNLLASAGLDLHDLVTLISGEEKPIVELLRSLLEKDDDVLLRLGRAGASLFHSQQGATFADVIVRKHRVTWQITSPEFEDWLLHQFFLERRRAPTASAMRNAIRSLSAQAKFEGDQHDVQLRAADSGNTAAMVSVSPRIFLAVNVSDAASY